MSIEVKIIRLCRRVFGVLFVYCELSNAYGLGHTDWQHKLVDTLITPHLLQGARVRCCHDLPLMTALTFAIGMHSRLGSSAVPTAAAAAGGGSQRRSQRQQGKTPAAADKGKDCECVTMPGELVQRVV